jgi:hypothetical protein
VAVGVLYNHWSCRNMNLQFNSGTNSCVYICVVQCKAYCCVIINPRRSFRQNSICHCPVPVSLSICDWIKNPLASYLKTSTPLKIKRHYFLDNAYHSKSCNPWRRLDRWKRDLWKRDRWSATEASSLEALTVEAGSTEQGGTKNTGCMI